MISREAQAWVRQRADSLNNKIKLQAEEIELKAGKDELISLINLSDEGVSISGDKIDLTGAVSVNNNVFIDEEGKITAVDGTFSGTVTATSGYIGSEADNVITIGDDSTNASLYSGSHSSLNSTANGFYLGADGLSIGSAFNVSASGALTATSGTFTGEIHATSGTIDDIVATNLEIQNGTLTAQMTASGFSVSSSSNTAFSRMGISQLYMTAGSQYTYPSLLLGISGNYGGYLTMYDSSLVGITLNASTHIIKTGYGTGYVELFGGDASNEPYIKIMSSYSSGNNVTLTPSSNVAALSYTTVATF